MIKIEMNLSDIDYYALANKLLPLIKKDNGLSVLGLGTNVLKVLSDDKKENLCVKIADEHSLEIKKALENVSKEQGVKLKINSLRFKKVQ